MNDIAKEFVRVRLIRIQGYDLSLFDFDYDLTWTAFFMNADERTYGRYGSRDASGPDAKLSLAGLKYAMQSAVAAHKRLGKDKPPPRTEKPLRVDDYPAAKRTRGECIHCHQVYEFRRAELKATGKWDREVLWAYPLPENLGLTLEVDRGDRVRRVQANSPAEAVGLAAGDWLRSVNQRSVASIADVQYALHKSPAKGIIPLTWDRNGKTMTADLQLPDGWRKTNITWRPSMLDILPSLSLSGEDLTPAEKKGLGLNEKRLAFRQDKKVHRDMKAAGVQGDDVIVGIDAQTLEMTMPEFLGYIRRNYLVGDKITLNVLRDGKKVDLPLTLK